MLPPDIDAAVAVMLHTGAGSLLADTLGLRSPLPVTNGTCGTLLVAGHAYVAPPGAHLIVNPDATLTVSHAPRVRLFRPSADWLFESAAASFGPRHIAVVLSGLLTDGARGLQHVKRSGGTVLVQSPADAERTEMPEAAIATGCADAVLPAFALAKAILSALAQRDPTGDRDAWDAPFGALVNAS